MIVTGGSRVGNLTTRVYDDDGTLLWSADHGATVYGVAADASGNVYTAGTRVGNLTTRKYDSTGNLLWSADHGAGLNCIAVDSAGNVVTGGSRVGNLTTRKYDSTGNLLWSADHGAAVDGVAADQAGNVYAVGAVVAGVTLRKYAPDGTPGMTLNFGNRARAIAVDPNGYIFQAGDRSLNYLYTLRRYAPDGTAGWTKDQNNTIYACAASPAGSAIMAGAMQTNIAARAYNSAGTAIPIVSPGSETLYGAAFDTGENRLLVGARTNSKTVWKCDTSGTLLWSADHGADVYAVAFAPSPVVRLIPGLPLPLGLGVPSTGTYIDLPALSMPLALGVPSVSEHAEIDIAGRAVAQLYRAYLAVSGQSGITEIPFASLQCERRLGASTWVTLAVPAWSEDLESLIESTMGGELAVYAGYRALGGGEVLGPFLRATITDYRYERDPRSASITIVGRVITPSYAARTRTLKGVQSRNPVGRRRAVCDVDPLLRPNDTVIDGPASFIVGAISYRITPNDASMRVEERGSG